MSRNPFNNDKPTNYGDENNSQREAMQKKLLHDANQLLEYISIEMTVGSQMDATKKQIKDLTKMCKDEDRMIMDLEDQIHEEERIADQLDQTGNPQDDVDTKNTDYIVQLEEKLQELYEEKNRLLKNRRHK
ncbi:hypothetical protein TRFO_23416 [Tritrichomonas foetus]|uniref:Uncharacterized protein n=1 Tax=Tritrichomonas foetus TaxID=1144522 RepID=A0A1J4KFL9_9EUKA|nr:hypothetical protein TRFO_23416 [Tritrichomonas foetus]|eukprot:OHT08141.1 hypothetical protein TRFO_23416 [Tritrichomonas foetus]